MLDDMSTLAYKGDEKWFGAGNKVDDNASIDDMLAAAGLNWSVSQHPVFAKVDGKQVKLPRKALFRDTDNKYLTITGDNWKPVQNKDAMEFFRDYTRSGGATLDAAGSLRDGQIIWGLASVKKGFTINGRDKVKGCILLLSPHQVGKAISVRSISLRTKCTNTFPIGNTRGAEYAQNHLKDFDVESAREMVMVTKESIGELEKEIRVLMRQEISQADTIRVLAHHLQKVPKEFEKEHVKALIEDPSLHNKAMRSVLWAIDNAPGATPGNAWGVLNGVTYWADHMAGRIPSTRMFHSWLGYTGKHKETIKQDLLELAS